MWAHAILCFPFQVRQKWQWSCLFMKLLKRHCCVRRILSFRTVSSLRFFVQHFFGNKKKSTRSVFQSPFSLLQWHVTLLISPGRSFQSESWQEESSHIVFNLWHCSSPLWWRGMLGQKANLLIYWFIYAPTLTCDGGMNHDQKNQILDTSGWNELPSLGGRAQP